MLCNGADRAGHACQPFRELIPPRSRDHQPFLRPGHADVEEFHVLCNLGFRGFDLAEADEGEVIAGWKRGNEGFALQVPPRWPQAFGVEFNFNS